MKLQWTRWALQDVKHLHAYIAEDNPQAAQEMVARIQEAASRLKRHAYMGKPGRVPETRELLIAGSPYIMVYLISGEAVQMVSVLHAAQRWPEQFDTH